MSSNGCAAAGSSIRRVEVRIVYTRLCIFLATLFVFLIALPSIAHATSLTASWNPNPEPDIAGYRLSYGTASGSYTTTIDVGNVTSYSFSVTGGLTYYFALQAYDTMGFVSEYSAEAVVAVSLPSSPPPPSGGGGDGGGSGIIGTLSPFSGAPVVLPGEVDAEEFDNGGEGVAYHDSTPGNSGGQSRNTDVDIEAASEGGYDVGWTAPGEWLNYTVSVASAGTYTVNLRVASPSGASMHVGFNNASSVWQVVSVPNTGDWQNWTTVSFTATLGAGTQQMTILFDNGGMNLRNVVVSSSGTAGSGSGSGSGGGGSSVSPPDGGALSPFWGSPISIPGTVQAQDFDNGGEGVAYHDSTGGNSGGQYRDTDVDIEASAQGGYDVGWTTPGEWLNYTVNVTSGGNRTVYVTVASVGGGTLHIGFNTASNVWANVSIPNTGGWQSWTTVSVPVTLGTGVQQITILFDTGNVNLRAIAVN